MKMNDYIEGFTTQLKEAISIGEKASLKVSDKKITNVLICGLGGSGIGGSIVADIVSGQILVPISYSIDYSIPNYVDENTLIIGSSYSGNTEETLEALDECLKRKAEVAIITSGGKLISIAKKNNLNHIVIPGGNPPRAMFAYSFTQLFFILKHYKIINSDFINNFIKGINLLDKEKENIKQQAKDLAKKIFKKTPVIYVANGGEGVAIRFRQQLNENSKVLCWHHVVPEMNHNELLGWRTNTENLAVIYLRNKSDYIRNQKRMDINKEVISKYTDNISDIWSSFSRLFYSGQVYDWIFL
jgi:glucose/mannose-6-phosphate isomerase